MGCGGYLPKSLARLVFSCGCDYSSKSLRMPTSKTTKDAWSFSYAISFACIALRSDTEDDRLCHVQML